MVKKDVLSLLKGNVTITTDGSHPAESLDIEGKNHYLNALAVLAAIDDNFSIAKKEYIKKIIARLKLNEEKLEELIEIGNDPSEEIISEFMDYFKKSEMIYHLLIDCFTLADLDGVADESVNKMIDLISQNANITAVEKEFLKTLPEIIRTKNVEKAFNLLFDNKELFEKFKSILLPYGIDLAKYHEELKILLDFETIELYSDYKSQHDIENGFEAAIDSVNVDQFVRFLNYKNRLNELVTDNNSDEVFITDNRNEKYICLSNSKVVFEDDVFNANVEFLKYPITGIDKTIALKYAHYVSKIIGSEYSIIRISICAEYSATSHLPYYAKIDKHFQDFDEFFYITDKQNSRSGYWLMNRSSGWSFSSPEYFSDKLTFRLMKKVEPNKTEMKTKK